MNKVTVKIDGVEYTVAGEKNEAEIVKVAKFIDGELIKINKAAPSLSKINAAILTSVNIADQLFDAKEKIEELNNKIEEMKNTSTNKDESIEKEFDKVLAKLAESDASNNKLNQEILDLRKQLIEKDHMLAEESTDGQGLEENSRKKISNLENKIKEMESKVAVAEAMASEFQNKAYNIQLNYEALKNSINK
ncbi:cell division protein ZapA [Peptostreptococcus equinus]|uniref:Cell division protein ZapA n=1 Tax=Peptostreptococcus equinus TaxID=3003601 RepID=A0ABY7JQ79_9FIRM|nr:cell division protein ZapA [Peptostreptococcus sp. CBA3647]WAW15504.1 cell division protein ZapA [Peptostreptococcus sp. CBA3647]